MLYFGLKFAPQAKILDFDTKKNSERGFPERGEFLRGGIRNHLILTIKIFLGGGILRKSPQHAPPPSS